MNTSLIYRKTDKGLAELKNGGHLPAFQLKVLQRIDGKANVAALIEAADAGPLQQWADALAALETLEFIQLQGNAQPAANPDALDRLAALPLPTIEVVELSPTESVQAWAEAKRGARELEEKGFYTPGTHLHHADPDSKARGVHVLVVEDDATTARILEFLLKQHGFQVAKAADSVAAFARLEQQTLPDVVLLDVMLPGQDGFAILRQIRGDARLQVLPVIMVTSQISDEHVMRGLKEGADGYVFKPFNWETLHGCIQNLI